MTQVVGRCSTLLADWRDAGPVNPDPFLHAPPNAAESPSSTTTWRRVSAAGGVTCGACGGRPSRRGKTAVLAISGEVAAALRGLPSHGWTRGMFGRGDRCLLVLSRLAGCRTNTWPPHRRRSRPRRRDRDHFCEAGTWTLLVDDDALMCGPCAVVRWLHALDLVITWHSKRDRGRVLKKAKAVTGGSPHLRRSNRRLDFATLAVPLLAELVP